MAIQKTSYRSYWVIGSGVLFIVSVIWFLIERNRNEKLADAIMKIAGSSNDPVTDPNSAKSGLLSLIAQLNAGTDFSSSYSIIRP